VTDNSARAHHRYTTLVSMHASGCSSTRVVHSIHVHDTKQYSIHTYFEPCVQQCLAAVATMSHVLHWCMQPCKHNSMFSTPPGVEQCCQWSIFATFSFHSSASGSAHPRNKYPIAVPQMVRIACQLPRMPRTSDANNHSAKEQGLPEKKLHASLQRHSSDMCPLVPILYSAGDTVGSMHVCASVPVPLCMVDQGRGSPAAPGCMLGMDDCAIPCMTKAQCHA
jgi:hypothetical protein